MKAFCCLELQWNLLSESVRVLGDHWVHDDALWVAMETTTEHPILVANQKPAATETDSAYFLSQSWPMTTFNQRPSTHQNLKSLYHFSFLLSIIVVQHDSPIKQLNLINHCGTPLYTYVPTKNAKLLTPSVGGQWNLGEIGRSAARKSMLLFHTPTVVLVLRIVGLSLITLTCLQEMQNCWHPQLGDNENLAR